MQTSKPAPNAFSFAHGAFVLLAIAATPLVFALACKDHFILPKIVWGQSLAVALLALAAVGAVVGRRVHLALHSVNVLLALFLLWHLAMWPLATSRSLATDRVFWITALVAISWAWQEWLRGAARRRLLTTLWALAASAGLTAAWALYQDLGTKWGWPLLFSASNLLGDWRGAITAGFGNTDFIAAFLATLYIPLLLFMAHVRGRLRVAILLIVLWLSAAALIVCWSVGGNGSLILASLIVLVGLGRHRLAPLWRKRSRRLLIWAGGCACAILWLVADTPLNPHSRADVSEYERVSNLPGIFGEAFSSERWIAGGPTRGVIWLNTMEVIRTHQLTGVGPGCFIYVYPTVASEFMPQKTEWLAHQGGYTNASHNSLMQTWAELGPLGAFLLLAMVVAAFRALGRVSRRAGRGVDAWIAWGAIGALATLCLDSMMTFPLQLPALALLFFCLLPIGEALGTREKDRRGTFQMPPLILQGRWTELILHLRGMRRLTALSASLDLPKAARAIAIALCLAVASVALWQVWIPLRADATYRDARELNIQRKNALARNLPDQARHYAAKADPLFQRALAIWPSHHDCRSEYSSFLLETGRYAECVAQMETVFERLDSRELYKRRGDAYAGLGRKTEAKRDYDAYMARFPRMPREEASK